MHVFSETYLLSYITVFSLMGAFVSGYFAIEYTKKYRKLSNRKLLVTPTFLIYVVLAIAVLAFIGWFYVSLNKLNSF
jgi:hypothetical protein